MSQGWELPERILERENATLREQLAIKDRQIGELLVLLQRARARALPPATTPPATPQVDPEPPRRAPRWRRVFRDA